MNGISTLLCEQGPYFHSALDIADAVAGSEHSHLRRHCGDRMQIVTQIKVPGAQCQPGLPPSPNVLHSAVSLPSCMSVVFSCSNQLSPHVAEIKILKQKCDHQNPSSKVFSGLPLPVRSNPSSIAGHTWPARTSVSHLPA